MYRVCKGVHQGDCGHVTPGIVSEEGCQHGDCEHVHQVLGCGLWSPSRLCMYDPVSVSGMFVILEMVHLGLQV